MTSVPALDRLRERDLRVAGQGLDDDPELLDAVGYMLASRGKQLRPGICLEAAKYGPNPGSHGVWRVATALELLQIGSLAHDDIVDDGAIRRGWESVAERNGTCVAGVAASWLFGRALELATHGGRGAVARFVTAARELCDGQLLDAEDVFDIARTPARYFTTIEQKTGSLFRLAASVGAEAAGAESAAVASLTEFGHHLGVVFQISDDMLDLAGTEAALGKPPGSDLGHGVYTLPVIYALEVDPTLPVLLPQAAGDEGVLLHAVEAICEAGGLDRALEDCERHAAAARDALDATPHEDAGAKERLRAILDYSIDRARPRGRL